MRVYTHPYRLGLPDRLPQRAKAKVRHGNGTGF
jgi:hypothetical protein